MTTLKSPFSKICERCGETFLNESFPPVFEASYLTVGTVDGHHVWAYLNLCEECQHDLRLEFYRRGIRKNYDDYEKGDKR